jgi:CheY-like chemotaxis protein
MSNVERGANMGDGLEGRWVLVVDDNKTVREAVSSIVTLLGFKVAQASNGEEALSLFSQRGFDLVLTDLQMPGMDGLCLASKIKGESPETPVVLITGSMKEWVEKRMEESPVDHVIYKPFSVSEIMDTAMTFAGVNGQEAAL